MADDSKELQTQLSLQQSINKAIQDRAGLLQRNSQEISRQVEMQINLCKAMECKELDDVTARMKTLNESLAENRQRIDESSNSTAQLNGELKKTNKLGAKAKGALVGAFVGIKNAIGTASSAFGSLVSGILGLPGRIMRIGGAILGAWGSMTEGLMEMAQSGGGGGKPILDSLEKVRAAYGDLAGPTSSSVVKSWKNLKKEGSQLGAEGASMTKIFGRGRAGAAAALDFMRESAEALGPVFHTMADQLEKAGASLVRVRKGLGVTDNALQNMARSAKANGVDFKDALDEVGRASAHLSKTFGISIKAIGKNFSEMQGDIATFGDYTRNEMLGVAAAMAKVGMEMKDLQGIAGKTDDFESAANAVAGLSEAFGMQLDTMELMTADPAQKAEMMRDAFHQAGKSFEDMSRQEKARLADLSGMSQDALQGFLDPSNAGMSFDDFTAAAEDGADGAISQAEANKLLTKSIEKLNETMGGMSAKGGFFGTFMEGVKKGISRSPEFITLMREIRESMRIVYQAGKQVGKMLMELFSPAGPLYPVMKIFKEYFSPKKWAQRMQGVKDAFRSFVNMMKKDPKKALSGLLKDLRKVFLDGGGGEFAKTIKEGLVKGIDVIGSMILGAIPTLLGWIRDGMMTLLAVLKGEKSFSTTFFDDVAFPMILDAFKDLVKKSGPILKQMGDALIEMLTMFWDKYGEKIKSVFTKILTALFVAALIKAAATAAVGAAVGGAMKGIWGLISGSAKKLTPGPTGGGGGDDPAPDIVNSGKNIVETLKDMSAGDIANTVGKAMAMALLIGTGMVAMTAAFAIAAEVASDITVEDAIKTGMIWAVVALAVGAFGFALKQTRGMNTKDILKELAGITLAVIALGLFGLIAAYAISQMPDIGLKKVVAWGLIVAAIVVAAGVASFAAAKVAEMKIPWKETIMGLGLLGLAAIGIGAVAAILVLMIKSAGEPAEIAAVGVLMLAMAALFGVIALVVPVAAMLGIMLMSQPWGLAGIAVILAGFAVLGLLAIGMVEGLLPTIQCLVDLAKKIPDIDAFKAVSGALIGIMRSVGSMMDSMANLAKALNPGPFGASQGRFNDTLKTMQKFVDNLFQNNIGTLVDKLILLAKTPGLNEQSIAAISAISSVLEGVGAIMQSMSMSDGAYAAVAEASSVWDPMAASRLMSSVTNGVRAMGGEATRMIRVVSSFIIKDLIPLVKGQDFSKVGPLLAGIGPMFSGIAAMMTSFSPNDAAFKAVEEAADTWGEDSVATIDALTRQMVSSGPQIRSFIKEAGLAVKGIITSLGPVLDSIGKGVDPEALASIADIVGSTFSGMGNMLGALGPIVEGVVANASKYSNFTEVMDWMFSYIIVFMNQMVTALTDMMDPMKAMITSILGLASGIKDPELMKKKVDVISTAFSMLGTMMNLFTKGGPLSSVPENPDIPNINPITQAATSMVATMDTLFAPTTKYPKGLISTLIDYFDKYVTVKNPRSVKNKAEVLGATFSAISEMAAAIGTLSDMDIESVTESGMEHRGKLRKVFVGMADLFDIKNSNNIIKPLNRLIVGSGDIKTVSSSNKRKATAAADFLKIMNPVVTGLSNIGQLPTNIEAKITAVVSSFDELSEFMKAVNNDPNMKVAIDLGKALSGKGEINVKHQNVILKSDITINVDAAQFAQYMVNDVEGRELLYPGRGLPE